MTELAVVQIEYAYHELQVLECKEFVNPGSMHYL